MDISLPAVAGLVSASGSTCAAVYKACLSGELPARLAVVIASNPNAGEALKELGYPNIVLIERKTFSNGLLFGEAIIATLEEYSVVFAGLWGWNPTVPANVIKVFRGRITNQHPDLPKDFGGQGMNGIIPVCAHLNFAQGVGRPMAIHPVSQWVDEETDAGDVVMMGEVPIDLDNDTCESLYERVKLEEHKVQIATVAAAIRAELKEIVVVSPVQPGGEEVLLAQAKELAFAHHDGQTQSQLKRTKVSRRRE